MELNKKLYELRKQKGISQEELSEKLNVSRQTLSKWELGTSTPDMEKLIAISDYFEISLDELVLGKEKENLHSEEKEKEKVTMAQILEEKVLTEQTKVKTKKGLKIVGIVLVIILAIDLISMVIAFLLGFPK